jgi:peptide/nickel transport system ATP-binding protein
MTATGTIGNASGMAQQNNPGAPVLRVNNLKAYYRTRAFGVDREVRAVDGISLDVRRNEIYGLAGESSSGKSTLIKTIAAALRPPLEVVDGTVAFSFLAHRESIFAAPPEEIESIRWRHLSYIMQGSMNVLNPVRRIRRSFEDFAARHIAGTPAEFDLRVKQHLALVKLDASVLTAYPHELSGGMRQRVTIALATICRPDFVIADEPTTALDVVVQKSVLQMIRDLQQEIGSSVLVVTHDMGVHAHLTDRLAIMYAGRLVEESPTAELFREPLHPYTAHLISSLPRIGDDNPRRGLEGTPPNLADPPSGCRFHPRCPLAMDRCRHETPAMVEHAPGRRVACFAVKIGQAGG